MTAERYPAGDAYFTASPTDCGNCVRLSRHRASDRSGIGLFGALRNCRSPGQRSTRLGIGPRRFTWRDPLAPQGVQVQRNSRGRHWGMPESRLD